MISKLFWQSEDGISIRAILTLFCFSILYNKLNDCMFFLWPFWSSFGRPSGSGKYRSITVDASYLSYNIKQFYLGFGWRTEDASYVYIIFQSLLPQPCFIVFLPAFAKPSLCACGRPKEETGNYRSIAEGRKGRGRRRGREGKRKRSRNIDLSIDKNTRPQVASITTQVPRAYSGEEFVHVRGGHHRQSGARVRGGHGPEGGALL